jgi:hypothetical protein
MSRYDEVFKKALDNVEHPLSEITRRNTYRARSPGVKPTTGIKLILPKTSSMAQKIQKVLDGDDPKKLKQMNNLVIGREDDGKEISLEFKTSASREKFRKMMNEGVELDETVRTAFKGGGSTDKFQQNLKKFGFDKDYRKMMQNFIKRAKPGDGFYVTMSDKMIDFQIHPVADMMMGAKIKKLGDKDDLGEFGTRQLVAIKEDVQLDEGTMNFLFDSPLKAGAFAKRIMRDKLASEVDRYVDHGKRKEVVEIITHPDNYEKEDILKLAKRYKGTFHSMKKEDVQLDETNFRFPEPGEYYGDLTKSISDDPYYTMSKAELKKRSDEVDRKFASVMRKHKRTKVGEVLDLLDKDGGTKLYKDSDIKQINKYLTKFKGNVRKVAHEMLIIVMQGDDYLAKKRIPVTEGRMQDATKKLPYNTKKLLAKQLNRMNLGGYGDYNARPDNVHKFKDTDLAKALRLVHPSAVAMALKEAESLKWTGMKDTEKEELVRLAKVPARVTEMKWKEIPNPLKERLAKYINKSTKGEFALVEERAKVPTYVIDRKTKKIVHGPTDTADAKLYLDKQITPRKFMIRQIRGAAKKVGDKV